MLVSNETAAKIYKISHKYEEARYNMYDLSSINKEPAQESARKRKAYSKMREILLPYIPIGNLDFEEKISMVLIDRMIYLKDTALHMTLKSHGLSNKNIKKVKNQILDVIEEFYTLEHEKMIRDVVSNVDCLNPAFKSFLMTWTSAGRIINDVNKEWETLIVDTANKELDEHFENKQEVMSFLMENNLLDIGHNNQIADRTYSILYKQSDGTYQIMPYIQALPSLKRVIQVLERGVDKLGKNYLRNKDFLSTQNPQSIKEIGNYFNYLQALIQAFKERNVNNLVKRWANVDKIWMQIQTPVQPGHPLEYYKDEYRKAVEIEWDLRIKNVDMPENDIKVSIENMFLKNINSIENNHEYETTKNNILNNLNKVQTYVGKPLIYFGSAFTGLASAQVVPNDEMVSRNHGKKIFAYPERGNCLDKNKPFLKLDREIFGHEIIDIQRRNIFQKPERELKVYEITTIGHEYGHLLWNCIDTEMLMNVDGNFKNIEEFKATAGALVAFFDTAEEQEYYKDVFGKIIYRVINLIKWHDEKEVEPYFCESLFFLNIMFKTKTINFNTRTHRIFIDFSKNNYESFKNELKKEYNKLFKIYLDKKPSNEFLMQHLKIEGAKFISLNKEVNSFIDWFLEYYEENHDVLEDRESKEDWEL